MKWYRIAGCTDKGPVRAQNEDHILMGRFLKNSGRMEMRFAADDDFIAAHGLVLAVADGVGGERGGKFASEQALVAFDRQFYSGNRRHGENEDFIAATEKSGARANETILAIQKSDASLCNMACTLAGVCVMPAGYVVFHAGDSRVYRVRDKMWLQLTHDDTELGRAVAEGLISEQEASTLPARHTISNYVGKTDFRLHITPGRDIRAGDLLVVCSDGIHDLIDTQACLAATAGPVCAAEVANLLAAAAVQAGGRDNLSVIVLEVEQGPDETEDHGA